MALYLEMLLWLVAFQLKSELPSQKGRREREIGINTKSLALQSGNFPTKFSSCCLLMPR